jgi:hypothetical protein
MTMGYDLVAKRRKRGTTGYYRAGIEFMTFLRSAMVAAGVPEALVYKKFVSNDNLLVTPLQSRTIAEQLTTWLRGRNLTLDLAETNERARASADALFFVLRAVGNQKETTRLARRRRAKSLPLRVDRKGRKAIREFAAFCAGSGGFHVG